MTLYRDRGLLGRLTWAILSAPMYVKILGIVLIVTLFFCSVTYYQTQKGLFRVHYEFHVARVDSIAHSLAALIENSMRTGDVEDIDKTAEVILKSFEDARFVFVVNNDGDFVSHQLGFDAEVPDGLFLGNRELCAGCHPMPQVSSVPEGLPQMSPDSPYAGANYRFYRRDVGYIIEARVPIGDPPLGYVRVGLADDTVIDEATSVNRAIIEGFVFSACVGFLIAIAFGYAMVRPVLNLVSATNRLTEGDYSVRADVYSSDEIGRLAQVFNRMAEHIEVYREEVRMKERVRQQLLDKVVQAQEDERKVVARELHDQLGQSLSKTLVSFQTARAQGGCKNSNCTLIDEELRGMIDEVRQLAWGLRPSILDDYGLDSALERYVKDISERSNIPFGYSCGLPSRLRRLPDRMEVSLYRITQEAITNVLRYAEATEVSVTVVLRDGKIVLVVEDNGKGFDLEKTRAGDREALGLLGMEERASLIGGELTIETQPGEGCRVRIEVPLPAEAIS